MAYSIWDKQPELALPKLPFELVLSLAEMTRKKQEEADTTVDKINESMLSIPAIPVDVPGRDKRITELQQQIYDISDMYSNNMAQALPALKSLQRELNKEMSIGYLSGVKKRHTDMVKSFENLDLMQNEYIKTGGKQGMSPEDVQAVKTRELTDPNYNGAPIQRTPSGAWQSYNQYERLNTYNYSDKANELGKWLGEHPEKVTQLTGLSYSSKTGYYEHGDVTRTVMTAEAIQRALKTYFRNDPEVTKYVDWQAGVSGKHDAARKLLAEGAQKGYIPSYDAAGNEISAYNPDTWINQVYTPSLYTKADQAADAVAAVYQRNEIDRNRSYVWNQLAEEGRKREEQMGYAIVGQAPMTAVPGTTLDPSIFDPNAGVKTGKYLFTSNPRTGEARYLDPQGNTITREQYDKAMAAQKGSVSYIDLKDLSAAQQQKVSSYLRTLSKSTDMGEAAKRIMDGKGTDADKKLVYPALKKMSEAAVGTNQMNSTFTTINDKLEIPLVNQMLSGRTDEVISVQQLGAGLAGDMKVRLPDGQSVPYKDFVTYIKNNAKPESLVSIPAKLRGVNALTNATGDLSFGNAYQMVIEGVPYYLHGDYQFTTDSPKGKAKQAEKVTNEYTAMFGQAQATPRGTSTGNYFGIPVEWVYMPDAGDPNKGTYNLTGFGTDAQGNIMPVTPGVGTQYSSAEEMERVLRIQLSNTLNGK